MNNDLTIIKDFETKLKEHLIKQFGTFIPENKISLLNSTSYVTKEVLNKSSNDEKKCELTRNMLGSLMDIKCYKEIDINGSMATILYGRNLERALIEYYAQDLSRKFNFNINEIQGLNNDLETVKLLDEKLDGRLSSYVFNTDAIKLLNIEELKEIAKKYDTEELEKYLTHSANVSDGISFDMLKSKTEEGRLEIITIDNRKYIKYVDKTDTVHLIDINDSQKAMDYCTEELSNLGPNEKIIPEKFFYELNKIVKEKNFNKVKNYETINMYNYIENLNNGNNISDIYKSGENGIVINENENDVFRVEINKDERKIESEFITKDGDNRIIAISFDELFNKFLNNELSKEEFLGMINIDELNEEQLKQLRDYLVKSEEKEKGPTLTPYNNPYGFANKSFILYVFIIAISIALVLSIVFQNVN